MATHKIFSVDILDLKLMLRAKALNADIIVSNERVFDTSKYPEMDFINSEVYRVPGTFESYAYNQSVIKKLLAKYSGKFIINGVHVGKAIPKLVYWTNYKIGYLNACIKDKLKEGSIVYITGYLSGNKLKEAVKYLKYYTSNNLKFLFHKKKHLPSPIKNRRIGLLVNDSFELGMFEYLIKAIPVTDLVVFNYGNIDFKKYGFVADEVEKTDISRISKYSPQRFVNPLTLSSEELNVINIISRDWQSISDEIEQYKFMKSTSVTSLIINVGENLPVKNLLPDVFGDKIRVYNTMNGMKSGEAHDGDVYFNEWFVWDEKMKAMLVEKCGVPPDMLSVTGHLMKDFVYDYRYGNTLDIPDELLKNKKVISIFSVKGNREEKQEAFNYLYKLLEKDQSYFLIIRLHPLESREDFFVHPKQSIRNLHFAVYDRQNSKQTLYDQIYVSDIGIVFGSTVAMECQWMNVPVVTFEKKETSNIYCIDNLDIRHVKSIQELGYILEKLEKKTITRASDKKDSVAEKMVDKIMKYINKI